MKLLLLILYISVSRAHKDDDYHLTKNLIMDINDGLDYHNNFDHSSMYENQSHEELMHGGPKIYKPDWDDLDTRPLPRWYDKAKVGIFLHWGVFSVPSFGSEWFWCSWKDGNKAIQRFMDMHYPPNFTYPDFAPMFTAEFFDPDKWARLFADSGARYVVLTSKHHEGFTLFPSKRSFNWNSLDIGPKRDLVGELAAAVRKQNMKFGLYHSLYEWFNPIYLQDKELNFTTRYYPDTKLWPDLKQISKVYKPSVIWSDGDWEAYDTYWNSTGFLAWLYNSSPMREEVVVNDRWGKDIPGHHGDFYNHDDRYNPGVLQSHKWENAFTIDSSSWGFRRNMDISEVLTFDQLLYQLVSTVSCGGNVLINVGPTKEGTISPIFQERLLSLGAWLGINGEAIYDTSPWHHQNDTHNNNTWYTCTTAEYNYLNPVARPLRNANITNIYAILLKWPEYNLLTLRDMAVPLHSGTFTVKLLGNNEKLNWKITNGLANIELPDKATVVSQNAWVVKFTKT